MCCEIFARFFPHFMGFYPDFRQIKNFGAIAPHAPPPPTPVLRTIDELPTNSQLYFVNV